MEATMRALTLLLAHPASPVIMALLGAIWGSFAAALVHRWPAGRSVLHGRSSCDMCHQELGAAELVPILTYLWQGGRCRHCAAPIRRSYLAAEVAGALAGLAAGLSFSGPAMLAAAMLLWLLMPLAWLDWRHLWLPDSLLLWLGAAGLLLGGLAFGSPLHSRVTGGVAGYAVLEMLRLGYRQLRRAEGMGAGDPKLMGAIGLWTGWALLPFILALASLIGIGHVVASRGIRASGHGDAPAQAHDTAASFPLGTYLCAAAAIMLFAGLVQP